MKRNNFHRLCLVHYHEIGLKGKNRSYFENLLKNNIKKVLKFNGFDFAKVNLISGRILVFLNDNINFEDSYSFFSCLKNIPGIARVSLGIKVSQDIESMTDGGICLVNEALERNKDIQSFKLNARRNHTSFKYDSIQINRIVGGKISDAFPQLLVKMKNPDLEIKLEVIEGSAYVYGISDKAVGGLPVGSGGKMLGMISSGIDSPVALWKMARRGASIVAVHFSGAPVVSAESEYLVKEISSKLQKYGCIQKLYIVRIGKYQKLIAQDCPEKLRIILYRRFMYMIAGEIAKREHIQALVTGESLGQVASQTVENLYVTTDAVDIPVFRPLIGSDKQEIIDRANLIETFELSSQKAADCCTLFMPHSPETHAKLKYVKYAEENFDYATWINEAIENGEVLHYNI